MTLSASPLVPVTKRGRGRPKGSQNKPKDYIVNPRRNPRRVASTRKPVKRPSPSHSPCGGDFPTVNSRFALRQEVYHIDQMVGILKRIITPGLPYWSKAARQLFAQELLELSKFCLPEHE
ncbi:hypothetical protein CF326_g7167 [Tilletia indica]|nr:hypothetical protein CF326_g7167 [Tilletia indica]